MREFEYIRHGTQACLLVGGDQITQIVALSCEEPQQSGRPITNWTQRELADEAEKRGIVKKISHRSVGRFLKRGRKAMSDRQQAAPVAILAYQ